MTTSVNNNSVPSLPVAKEAEGEKIQPQVASVVLSTLSVPAKPAASLNAQEIAELSIDWHEEGDIDWHEDSTSVVANPTASEHRTINDREYIRVLTKLPSGDYAFMCYYPDQMTEVELGKIMDDVAIAILDLRQEISALDPKGTIAPEKSEEIDRNIIELQRNLKDFRLIKNLPPAQMKRLEKNIWLFKLVLASLRDGFEQRLYRRKFKNREFKHPQD